MYTLTWPTIPALHIWFTLPWVAWLLNKSTWCLIKWGFYLIYPTDFVITHILGLLPISSHNTVKWQPPPSYFGNSSVSPVSVSGFYWKTERDVYNANIDISELHNFIIVSVTFEEQDFKSVSVVYSYHFQGFKTKETDKSISFLCMVMHLLNLLPIIVISSAMLVCVSLKLMQFQTMLSSHSEHLWVCIIVFSTSRQRNVFCYFKFLLSYTFDFCGLVKTGSVGLKVSLDSGSANKQTRAKHEENRKHWWGGGWREFHNVELGKCVCL